MKKRTVFLKRGPHALSASMDEFYLEHDVILCCFLYRYHVTSHFSIQLRFLIKRYVPFKPTYNSLTLTINNKNIYKNRLYRTFL